MIGAVRSKVLEVRLPLPEFTEAHPVSPASAAIVSFLYNCLVIFLFPQRFTAISPTNPSSWLAGIQELWWPVMWVIPTLLGGCPRVEYCCHQPPPESPFMFQAQCWMLDLYNYILNPLGPHPALPVINSQQGFCTICFLYQYFEENPKYFIHMYFSMFLWKKFLSRFPPQPLVNTSTVLPPKTKQNNDSRQNF